MENTLSHDRLPSLLNIYIEARRLAAHLNHAPVGARFGLQAGVGSADGGYYRRDHGVFGLRFRYAANRFMFSDVMIFEILKLYDPLP